jgi:hypothetical protein
VRNQPDQLVKRETSVNDGRKLREQRHVCVHLRVAKPEEERLVTNKPRLC